VTIQEAIEAEWYNGNVDEGARDRLLALCQPSLWVAPAPRHWLHRKPAYLNHRKDEPSPDQPVDVLGWTQHGAIVIATEPGWIPETEPVFVRMDELVLA
jgi:hypothetical protein